jgi:outer membrane immunogenic protein
MKRLALALLASTSIFPGLGQAASAADMAVKAPAYVPEWAGIYAGVHLGYNLNDPELVTSSSTTLSGAGLTLGNAAISPPGSGSNTMGRFVGGAQVGGNMQTGIWVYGVEADITAGRRSIGNSAFSNLNGLAANTVIQNLSSGQVEDDWYGTVRGRLGVARDHWLVYASGGFAYGEIKTTNTMNPLLFATGLTVGAAGSTAVTTSQIRGGWAAGAGAAYAWSDTVSLFAEWTRVDLGSQSTVSSSLVNVTSGAGTSTVSFQGRSDVAAKFDVIQVGVNVKMY